MTEFKPIKEGKVREIYDNGDSLIMVATDRISAFDYILKNKITNKGKVLTQMSKFWFDYTRDVVPNHLISVDNKDMPEYFQQPEFEGKCTMCRKLTMLPIECIVGDHDENITFEQSITVLEKLFPGKGEEYATKLRDNTIALYKKCAEYALSRGIIIADTKFEFGLDEEGNVILGDEMLTPDSSRFWPLEGYEAGHGQPSFDKQFVRNWLKANPDSDFNLPQDIIDKTIAKYEEAYEMLTGKKL